MRVDLLFVGICTFVAYSEYSHVSAARGAVGDHYARRRHEYETIHERDSVKLERERLEYWRERSTSRLGESFWRAFRESVRQSVSTQPSVPVPPIETAMLYRRTAPVNEETVRVKDPAVEARLKNIENQVREVISKEEPKLDVDDKDDVNKHFMETVTGFIDGLGRVFVVREVITLISKYRHLLKFPRGPKVFSDTDADMNNMNFDDNNILTGLQKWVDQPESSFWTDYANFVDRFAPTRYEQIVQMNFIIWLYPHDTDEFVWDGEQKLSYIDELQKTFQNNELFTSSLYRRLSRDNFLQRRVAASLMRTVLANLQYHDVNADVESIHRLPDAEFILPDCRPMNRKELRQLHGDGEFSALLNTVPAERLFVTKQPFTYWDSEGRPFIFQKNSIVFEDTETGATFILKRNVAFNRKKHEMSVQMDGGRAWFDSIFSFISNAAFLMPQGPLWAGGISALQILMGFALFENNGGATELAGSIMHGFKMLLYTFKSMEVENAVLDAQQFLIGRIPAMLSQYPAPRPTVTDINEPNGLHEMIINHANLLTGDGFALAEKLSRIPRDPDLLHKIPYFILGASIFIGLRVQVAQLAMIEARGNIVPAQNAIIIWAIQTFRKNYFDLKSKVYEWRRSKISELKISEKCIGSFSLNCFGDYSFEDQSDEAYDKHPSARYNFNYFYYMVPFMNTDMTQKINAQREAREERERVIQYVTGQGLTNYFEKLDATVKAWDNIEFQWSSGTIPFKPTTLPEFKYWQLPMRDAPQWKDAIKVFYAFTIVNDNGESPQSDPLVLDIDQSSAEINTFACLDIPAASGAGSETFSRNVYRKFIGIGEAPDMIKYVLIGKILNNKQTSFCDPVSFMKKMFARLFGK